MPPSPIDLKQERGAIKKKWTGRLPVALLFPNVYELAMSNLGLQQVYAMVNGADDMVCERVFLPPGPAVPLSVESGRPLADFPVILCALSFEHDYLNLLRLLRWGNIAPLSDQRAPLLGPGEPLVIGGGVATFINPEPLAPFIDLFWVGEAEAGFMELLAPLAKAWTRGMPERSEFLAAAALAGPGRYVPSLYDFCYGADGTLAEIKGGMADLPLPVTKVIAPPGSPVAHSTLLTPNTEFSDLYLAELGRGCSRGCRFCAAGFVYRPPRLWEPEAIIQALAEKDQHCQRVGLLGMEMAHPEDLAAVASHLTDHGCALSFSSLRADALSPELLELLAASKLKTAAIAPDGASERLRRVINKGLTSADLITAARSLVAAGVVNLKLYFMIGLPTETEDDLTELLELVAMIKEEIDVIGRKRGRLTAITVSLNSFVPKAWTPFQYVPFAGVRVLKKRLKLIRQGIKELANVRLKVDRPDTAFFQAVLARGDRRLAPALLAMAEGKRNWRQVMADFDLDPLTFAGPRGEDEQLPWQVIAHHIKPGYLWQEYQRGLAEKKTMACEPAICKRCGVC
ncbi:MAG: radical SAM protein [Thermodesulfobacteriota bacterium]